MASYVGPVLQPREVVAGLSPGRGQVPRPGAARPPGSRTGLTGHRALPRATTTMSHRGGPDHDDVTSSWLFRAAGAVWRGNREGCGTPGAWGAEPRGHTLSDAVLVCIRRAIGWAWYGPGGNLGISQAAA